MAISRNGIFGHQSGRVGNIVFYTLNGQHVSRAIGRYVDKPTDNQKVNRNRMSVVMSFLKSLHTFIKQGFELEAKGTVCNAFNLAVSYNKKYALKGKGLDVQVDYGKALLSKGSLPSTAKATISTVEGGVLLEWDSTADSFAGAYHNDMVTVGLYYPGCDDARVYLNEAKRRDGQLFIPVTRNEFIDQPVEAYISFKSANGERISDSVYAGNLNGEAETKKEKEEREYYEKILVRFEVIKEKYESQKDLPISKGKESRKFRDLEKEYKALLEKLEKLPGKKGSVLEN